MNKALGLIAVSRPAFYLFSHFQAFDDAPSLQIIQFSIKQR